MAAALFLASFVILYSSIERTGDEKTMAAPARRPISILKEPAPKAAALDEAKKEVTPDYVIKPVPKKDLDAMLDEADRRWESRPRLAKQKTLRRGLNGEAEEVTLDDDVPRCKVPRQQDVDTLPVVQMIPAQKKE